ncbi:hypothetical protein JCM10213_005836 [Rhodosporidiobolus nylandii]
MALYDLDRDGYPDTYLGGGGEGAHYADELYGYGGLSDAGWDYDYDLPHHHGGHHHHHHGLGGEYGEYGGLGGEYGWSGAGGGGYPDLYEYMNWLPDEYYDGGYSLYGAWGDESWAEEQYALADLMYFQRQLDLDTALDEAERLRRWDSRLAWEALSEEERLRAYRTFDPYHLRTLGLSGGFWGRRFGGRELDLSYLREVPLSRGLFGEGYRERFVRHPTLGRRYSPYFSRSRLGRGLGLGLGLSGVPVQPRPAAPYGSQRLSAGLGTGMSLRERELMGRLRVAEMRASLTGLSATQRAQALDDARRLRHELSAESRLAREIDRGERRSDALLAAREAEAERAELREEAREQRGLMRLEEAARELQERPLGGYGGSYGYY